MSNQQQNDILFAYWDLRGIGQIGRYLLSYCKLPFQEKRYCTFEEWSNDKETLGLDFPNLPYLIHGDKKISESLAVSEYIIRVAGRNELLGSDDDVGLQVRILTGVIGDLKAGINKLVFSTPKDKFLEEKEKAWSDGIFKDKLSRLNKYLGDKKYLCGEITLADFVLFNTVDILNDFDCDKLADYLNIVEFYKRFAEIPEIKKYRESDRMPKNWFPLKFRLE